MTAARSLGFAQLVANELPFHQELSIQFAKLCDIDIFDVFSDG